MSETPVTSSDGDEGKLPSLPIRLVQVFVSPIRLFEKLRDEPAAWGALLLGALLSGAASLLIPMELWENMMRTQITQAGQPIPDDLSMPATFARIAGSVGPLVFFPIMGAIGAGLYSLLFLFGMGYEGRYAQYFAVTAHALLLMAVAAALLTPLRILTGNLQFTVTLGALFPFLGDGLFARFLNLADLFSLWTVGLVGVGAAVIDGTKRPGPSAAIAIFALLLILLFVAGVFGVGARPG
ncbi:MAG: hypothetical protein WD056_01945 [Gemmatimonadota bacterium]